VPAFIASRRIEHAGEFALKWDWKTIELGDDPDLEPEPPDGDPPADAWMEREKERERRLEWKIAQVAKASDLRMLLSYCSLIFDDQPGSIELCGPRKTQIMS
jgi:hypothetical protein